MQIAPEQLEKFQVLFRAKFGVELSQKEALEKAMALLTIMKAVYRPMTEDGLARVKERQSSLT
jgi:hypothetical protein